MDSLKQHLFLIVCGVVAAASIGFGAIGLAKMSTITSRMNASEALLMQLQQATSAREGATNTAAIEAAEAVVRKCRANLEKIREQAEVLNRREPLVPDIFPKPKRSVLAYSFRTAYANAIDRLPDRLSGGFIPSSVDIENWKMALQEQIRQGKLNVGAGGSVEDAVRVDPAARASIDRARSIRCYIDAGSFDIHELYHKTEQPSLDQMWAAQTSLWIQQDIVETIAAMNEAAARKLPASEPACVLNLPVKRIVGIAVGDFIARTPSKSARTAGAERASKGATVRPPPEDPREVFTRRVPTSRRDIVYFRLWVVVDVREVLNFIAELSEKNLYTPIDVEMREVERADDFRGYLYGPDPVVDLQVAFEACFLSRIYRDLIPEVVQDRIRGASGDGM